MSVSEIQARIDKISADIVRQKEVLKSLRNNKSAAQRQLNALRDPVVRLPLEISSKIFVHCLPSNPSPNPHDAPVLFLKVSNTWTDIALATTELWASINLDAPRPMQCPATILDAWIKRAGSRVMSISLPLDTTDEIGAILRRQAHRLQSLTMHHDDDDIALVAAAGPFPSLRTLTAFIGDWDYNPSSADAIMNILHACPNLVKCVFDDVYVGRSDNVQYTGEPLIFPHIQHLTLGKQSAPGNDQVLQRINLPGLRPLVHSASDISKPGLTQFLRRSSPPLHQITLQSDTLHWPGAAIEECFSLLPMVVWSSYPRKCDTDHFFSILANSPHLLPNLSITTIHSTDGLKSFLAHSRPANNSVGCALYGVLM